VRIIHAIPQLLDIKYVFMSILCRSSQPRVRAIHPAVAVLNCDQVHPVPGTSHGITKTRLNAWQLLLCTGVGAQPIPLDAATVALNRSATRHTLTHTQDTVLTLPTSSLHTSHSTRRPTYHYGMALNPLFPDTHFPGVPGFSDPFASGMMMADPFAAFGPPVARGRPGAMMGPLQTAVPGSRHPMDIIETARGYEIHAGGWVGGGGGGATDLRGGAATQDLSCCCCCAISCHMAILIKAPAGGTVPASWHACSIAAHGRSALPTTAQQPPPAPGLPWACPRRPRHAAWRHHGGCQ
jgi:hypothetical protein